MQPKPPLSIEAIRADPLHWRHISRESALRAYRSYPVAVVHVHNGVEASAWLDEASPFLRTAGPYPYDSLRYYVAGTPIGTGLRVGARPKAGRPAEEAELEAFDFPVEELEAGGRETAIAQATLMGVVKPGPLKKPVVPDKPGLPSEPDLAKPGQPRAPEKPSLPEVPETPGLLEVELPGQPALPQQLELPGAPELAGPLAEAVPEEAETFYAVLIVDGVDGERRPVDGLDLVLEADGRAHSLTTRGGKARVDGVAPGNASLRFADLAAARSLLARSGAAGAAGARPEPAAPVLEATADAEPVRLRSGEEEAITVILPPRRLECIEVDDGMFRLDSAVVLPEGERPDGSAHEALAATGIFAAALAHAEAKPGKKMVIAGHTDTSAGDAHNQALSELRAECVLLCLEGGAANRERFGELAHGRHKIEDYKQILSWAAEEFGFSCKPPAINGNEFEGIDPIKAFQRDYNANRAALGVPDAEELKVDGSMGPKTWKAVFDCYEAALAKEVSAAADVAGRLGDLARLRGRLRFVDGSRKSVGFGEKHPIEAAERDNFRSQTNRRVEILFFEPGEEPDLAAAPEDSEIHRPGGYIRVTLDPEASDRPVEFRLCDEAGEPIPGALCELTSGQTTRRETATAEGILELFLPAGRRSVFLRWRAPGTPEEKAFAAEAVLDFGGGEGDQNRLLNLGYRAEKPEERIALFRGEFGREAEIGDEAILAEARQWHDGGGKPGRSGEAVAALNFPAGTENLGTA